MTFSDRLNPIFLYEIRRAVRNRSVLTLLCVYLVMLVAVVGYRFWTALERAGAITTESAPGGELALFVLLSLYVYVLLATLLHTVGSALHETFFDELAARTVLDWQSTWNGKLQVLACLTFLFYSAATPFLTLAWMLRGVDLPILLGVLLVMFLATLLLNIYVAASLVRCRNGYELFAAAFGLLFALPHLFSLVLFPFLCIFSVNDAHFRSGMDVVFFVVSGAVVTVVLAIGFYVSRTLFSANWRNKGMEDRIGLGCTLPWFAAFFVVIVIVLILGVISTFV